jgi:purine-binding chemotaxis protein CheW
MTKEVEQIVKKVADQDRSSQEKAQETVQLVVFELDTEEYGVEITDLQEIIRIPDITPIPNAPSFIPGIFNLRGKIIVVVDLENRFNLVRDNQEKKAEGNIVITEVGGNSYGIIVDQVSEIINASKDSIQATPELVSSKIHSDYLKGVVVLAKNGEWTSNKDAKSNNSRLIILLDLHKMLQERELLSLGKTIQDTTEN